MNHCPVADVDVYPAVWILLIETRESWNKEES
jgi:hypothetical protein